MAFAIGDELQAAGADEVRGHPTLRAHAKLHARIERFLAAAAVRPGTTVDADLSEHESE